MRSEYEDFFRAQNRALREGDSKALDEVTQLGQVLGERLIREVINPKARPETVTRNSRMAVERSQKFQEKKIRAMDSLHEDLRCIDEGEKIAYPDDARTVRMLSENAVEVIQPDGSAAELSLADLVADLQWGIVHELPVDAPRRMQRRYKLERTRREIEVLRDWQMGEFDFRALAAMLNQEKAIEKLHRGIVPGGAFIGYVAEVMVQSFLMRSSFDRDDIFRVSGADPVQDVVEKVDFIIDRPTKYKRGVDVEISGSEHVGIQFTKQQGRNLERKRRKMQHAREGLETEFDDVILVSVPGRWVRTTTEKWVSAGRPSGGPERFLQEQQRELLFTSVLEKMFTEEEIDSMWKKIQPTLPKKSQVSRGSDVKKKEHHLQRKLTNKEQKKRKQERRQERLIAAFSELSKGAVEVAPEQILKRDIKSAVLLVHTEKGDVIFRTTSSGHVILKAVETQELAELLAARGDRRGVFEILDGRKYGSMNEVRKSRWSEDKTRATEASSV